MHPLILCTLPEPPTQAAAAAKRQKRQSYLQLADAGLLNRLDVQLTRLRCSNADPFTTNNTSNITTTSFVVTGRQKPFLFLLCMSSSRCYKVWTSASQRTRPLPEKFLQDEKQSGAMWPAFCVEVIQMRHLQLSNFLSLS